MTLDNKKIISAEPFRGVVNIALPRRRDRIER